MMKTTPIPIAKITRPALPEVLARPRLFELLDRDQMRPIVWVSGPPGAGKTTLVTSYLAARKHSALWYEVDSGDADPASFFYYMGLAAKQAAPRKKAQLPLLTPEYRPGLEAFTRQFICLLCERLPKECVLVLDNYHAAPLDSSFHEVIRHLFDAMPTGRHAIVISRGGPPPTLTRLRASQAMEVLDPDVLRATPQETHGIATLKHVLSDQALQILQKAAGGWIAGIILMAHRASIGGSENQSQLDLLTKDVYDYFAGEIFEQTDTEVQEFLMQSAFFDKMTVGVVEGLTHQQRTEGMLDDLAHRGYFTEKHEGEEAVYQYHALFRKFLLRRAEEAWTPARLAQVRHDAVIQLEQAGQLEDAVGLAREAGDWSAMVRLILGQAPALLGQGRYATLEGWLTALPSSVLEENAWLLYWLGICRLQYAPPLSRNTLEQAFELFVRDDDEAGSLMSWSGVVNSILHGWDWEEHSRLDGWVAWMDERMHNNPQFPSPDIAARVACDMAHILLYRQMGHPEIATWMDRAMRFARRSPDPNLRMQVVAAIAQYDMWTGQFREAAEMVKEIQKISKHEETAPTILVQAKIKEAMYFATCTLSMEQARKAVDEGLEAGGKSGIPLGELFFNGVMVLACINADDLGAAGEFQAKMEAATDMRDPLSACHYYYTATLLALCRDQAREAAHFSAKGLELVTGTGSQFPEMALRQAMAQALYDNGEHRAAVRELELANKMSLQLQSTIHYFMGLLAEAQFAFDSSKPGAEARGLKSLREALRIGREQGYNTVPGWRSRVMAKLCVKALENDIEVDYATTLVRAHNLLPESSAVTECEAWPWPIKIYTLGRFGLVRNGARLRFAKRGQEKVIEMLKAMIALGTREVGVEHLTEALWPEAEGDKAHQAFKTTLHRLRKLLGSDVAIALREGRVTLDPRYCWVDVPAFERLLGYGASDTVASEKAVKLYQGPFLGKENESAWAISLRERLHAKYLRRLGEVGRHWESEGEWAKAATYYQHGLGIDPLVEEYYQRLMICHLRQGHRGEAMSIYQRCSEALRTNLGIAPSPETEAIFRSVHERTTTSGRPPSERWRKGADDQTQG